MQKWMQRSQTVKEPEVKIVDLHCKNCNHILRYSAAGGYWYHMPISHDDKCGCREPMLNKSEL